MKNRIIIYSFWILCITDIVANVFHADAIVWAVKPLLMPALVYYFISNTNYAKEITSRLMVAGLFFCWLGDISLLFEKSHPLFFIVGLACFLSGHIFYIFYYNTIGRKKINAKSLVVLLPVALYVFILLYILYPSLGALKVPVILYAIVLAAMLSMALLQYQQTDAKTAFLFSAGAASFVISDSLLAINKFYHPLSQAGFFIMLTYCAAQFLLVTGGISVYRKNIAAAVSVE